MPATPPSRLDLTAATRNMLAGLDAGKMARDMLAGLDTAGIVRIAQASFRSRGVSASTHAEITEILPEVVNAIVGDELDQLWADEVDSEFETYELDAVLSAEVQLVLLATVWVIVFSLVATAAMSFPGASNEVRAITGGRARSSRRS